MVLGMGIFTILKKIFGNTKGVAVSCIILMLIYCIFAGSSVSTIRATLMFIISFSAKILGRSYDSLSALGLAGIVQMFLNPYALNNSGFWLSFLAVIGVTCVAPRLQKLLEAKKNWMKSLCVSFSATITTLPVVLMNYGTYPWYSVLLNLCILPLMSVLLFLSLGLIFIFRITEGANFFNLGNRMLWLVGLKKLVTFLIKAILRYMEFGCEVFEKIPFQDGYLGSPEVWQILIYVILIIVVLSELWSHSLFCKKVMLVSALGILTLSTNYGTELVMLDVGQGDSCVIRNLKGNIYISDCGSSSVSKVGKYRLLPFLKHKGYGRIKGIFVSHFDSDHMNGIIELLELAKEERIEIEYLFLARSVQGKEEEKLEELLHLAEINDSKVVYLGSGDVITDGKMKIFCLHPGKEERKSRGEKDKNNQSLVLLVSEKNFRILLTGDVEKEGEKDLLQYIDQNSLSIDCQVLKVAHHGSSGSGSKEFIEKVQPKVSMISAGENNSYGHPHKETVEVLENSGSKIFTTIESGAIIIRGGRKIKVEKFKK